MDGLTASVQAGRGVRQGRKQDNPYSPNRSMRRELVSGDDKLGIG